MPLMWSEKYCISTIFLVPVEDVEAQSIDSDSHYEERNLEPIVKICHAVITTHTKVTIRVSGAKKTIKS